MTQPEARLQRKIQDELKRLGAFVFKTHGSEHQMTGLPDIIGCYRGMFIGIEVKMPDNKPSRIQLLRLREIERAGGVTCVAYGIPDAMEVIHAIDAYYEVANASNQPMDVFSTIRKQRRSE
jgi:Holliday junction resolvase